MKNILVIEDDKSLLNGLRISLEKDGYLVECVTDIKDAKVALYNKSYNCILMDLNLPDGDGIQLCKEIRRSVKTPIIMLTARDLEKDEIKGIESGADDYISKPFSVSVLLTRIKSLLRRSLGEFQTNTIEANDILLDLDTVKLFVKNKEVEVSATEFKLIKLLMENKGQVLLKEVILEKVWDDRGIFVDENTLSVNIRRIRQKMEVNPSKPKYIKTIRGMGYIWHS